MSAFERTLKQHLVSYRIVPVSTRCYVSKKNSNTTNVCQWLRCTAEKVHVASTIHVHGGPNGKITCGSEADWLACWTRAQKSPGFKSQPRRCRVTVLGRLFNHTHWASVHQAVRLAAALLTVAGVTAGLAQSNGSLPPGLWLTSLAGWLSRTEISSGTLRSVIEYGLPLFTTRLTCAPYNGRATSEHSSWACGAQVSVVRRLNEVTLRRARLVLGWVTVIGHIYHPRGVCNQPTR